MGNSLNSFCHGEAFKITKNLQLVGKDILSQECAVLQNKHQSSVITFLRKSDINQLTILLLYNREVIKIDLHKILYITRFI